MRNGRVAVGESIPPGLLLRFSKVLFDDRVELCADRVERLVQVERAHADAVAAHEVGAAWLRLLVGSRVE